MAEKNTTELKAFSYLMTVVFTTIAFVLYDSSATGIICAVFFGSIALFSLYVLISKKQHLYYALLAIVTAPFKTFFN